MITIHARNAHAALPIALNLLRERGIREDSRNGPVLRAPCPVTTVYDEPLERLVFHPWRDSNPFFLCVEALWMLAGRDDLKSLTPYVARMAEFSDDGGKTQPAAYGKRWREWIQVGSRSWPDQLDWAVKRLRANPNDRRVVIQMWDPEVDIQACEDGGKDVPCNLTVLPWVSAGALHITIFNRSNDIIWGLYSANAVQFSTLLEYLAGRLGLHVGTMTTVSNNFHMYEATAPSAAASATLGEDLYAVGRVEAPILTGLWSEYADDGAECRFQEDLSMLFEYPPAETQLKASSAYIRQVACPLMLAHKHYKSAKGADRFIGAREILEQMPQGSDWAEAAFLWISRREAAWLKKQEHGA